MVDRFFLDATILAVGDTDAGAHAKTAWWVCLVALVLACGAVPWLGSSGHLSIDEGVVHLMARETAAGRPFDLRTGYETYASPELLYVVPGRTAHTQVHAGRVVSQYPFGFAALAAPLYAWVGVRSLLAINVIGSALGLGLVASMAVRLTSRRRSGWIAAGLLAFAGFWLDYTFALWPHVAATTAWLAGVALLWPRLEEGSVPRLRPLAAGLGLGLGWCMRLDGAVLAAGTLGALAVSPARWRTLGLAMVGMALPVATLGLTNLAKFGTANPLSYGVDVDARTGGTHGYSGLLVLGLAVWTAGALVAMRRQRTGGSTDRLGGVLAGSLLAAAAVWQWSTVVDLAVGARALIFDLGMVPEGRAETEQLESGALVYGGAVKKALAQNCPHGLPLSLVALGGWFSWSGAQRRGVMLLVLPAVLLTTVFSLHAWHGGASINMRYFVPWLPVFAVLGAVGFERLLVGPSRRSVHVLAGVVIVSAFVFGLLALRLVDMSPADQDPWVRGLPMLLGSMSILLAVVWLRRRERILTRALGVTCSVAVGWAIGIGSVGDLRWSVRARERHAALERAVAAKLEPGSLVIAQITAPLFGLLERPGIMLASAQSDHGEDLARLVRSALADDRPVYLFFVAGHRTEVELGPRLPDLRFEVIPVAAGLALYRPTRGPPRGS